MDRKIKVRAIIVLDGKLFVAKLNKMDGTVSTFWSLIGGHVESGESLVGALHREIIEETAVEPQIGNLAFVHQFKVQNTEYIEFFFWVSNGADVQNVDLSATSHGKSEIAEIGFIDPTKDPILPKFLKDIDYSAVDSRPVEFYDYL